MNELNPIYNKDFYKVGHVWQYPKGVQRIYVNWTPRYTHVKGEDCMVHFGLHYFIQKVLIERFNEFFFWRPIKETVAEYKEFMKATLGMDVKTDHLERLHSYGRLPLDIWSLPEGSLVPLGVPAVVIANSDDGGFWLPNFIETMFSNYLWKPSTSASTARAFRCFFTDYAKSYHGESADLSFVDWQGHDFSYRGLTGVEDAMLSGLGHLTSFKGTDTIPAIIAARNYYGAEFSCGGSVPATEHSVMEAGSQDGELETFKRLITETYPTGIVSIVSDTWNLWKVLTEYVPALKKIILKREGKVVIRPDSGDPVKIMIGDEHSTFGPERAGVVRMLADTMGVDNNSCINKMGTIYGDGINLDRANRILAGVTNRHDLSPYNCVFGIGSYTYQMVTRDTWGLALKATAMQHYGNTVPIFKDPVTDQPEAPKKSLSGIPVVTGENGAYKVKTSKKRYNLDRSAMNLVMADGHYMSAPTLGEIRDRLKGGLGI